MVDTLTKGSILMEKYRQIAQIGELKNFILKALKGMGVEPGAKSISIYKNAISHIKRDGKPQIKEPAIDEIKNAVSVLDEAKHCYYDKDDNTLLYFYNKSSGSKMITYIAVKLDYTLKKFKTDNFVATITKIPFVNLKSMLKQKNKNGEKVRIKLR